MNQRWNDNFAIGKTGRIGSVSLGMLFGIMLLAPSLLFAARNDWRGGTDESIEYLTSDPANWTIGSQDRSLGFTYPCTVVFDAMHDWHGYVWVGCPDYGSGSAFDSDYMVWRSIDGSSDFGFSHSASGSDTVRFADAANQKARLRIESGRYTTDNSLHIGGYGGGGFVRIEQTGGFVGTTGPDTKTLRIGDHAGCDVEYQLTGTAVLSGGLCNINIGENTSATGSVSVAGSALMTNDMAAAGVRVGYYGNGSLAITDNGRVQTRWFSVADSKNRNGDRSSGDVEISGSGHLDLTERVYLGRNGNGVISVSGNGMITGASEMRAGVNANTSGRIEVSGGLVNVSGSGGIVLGCHSESSGTLALSGSGTVETKRITAVGNGSLTIDGGTLRTLPGAAATFIGASVATTIGGNGATIDTGDEDITIASEVVATGTIRKCGLGTLTFAANDTLPSLELYGGRVSGCKFSSVTVKGGATAYHALPPAGTGEYVIDSGKVQFDLAAIADTSLPTNVIVRAGGEFVIDIPSDTSVSDGDTMTVSGVTLSGGDIRVTGVDFDWTSAVNGDGTITLTAHAHTGELINRWLGGEYGDKDIAANWQYGLPRQTHTIAFSSDSVVAFKTADTNFSITKVLLENNARFELKTIVQDRSHYCKMYVGAMEGTGTVALVRCALIAKGGDVTVPSEIAIETHSNGSVYSWFNESGTQYTLAINGPLQVNGLCHIYRNVTVNGPVSGSGTLYAAWDNISFGGDNSAFTGAFRQADRTVYYTSPSSGFRNARSCEISGNLNLRFDDGRIAFGGDFSMTSTAAHSEITLPATASSIELLLGEGGDEVCITRGVGSPGALLDCYSIYLINEDVWTDGSQTLTVIKAGEGKMSDIAIAGAYNFLAQGGETVFSVGGSADVEVFDGAAISASPNLESEGLRLGSLILHPGAIVRQTLTGNDATGFKCPSFTLPGPVSVEGAEFDLIDGTDDGSRLSSATSEDATMFTVLRADEISGSPCAFRAIPMSEEGWTWEPRRNGTSVYFGRTNPGGGIIFMFSWLATPIATGDGICFDARLFSERM